MGVARIMSFKIPYRSFLLRLWCRQDSQAGSLYILLEDPVTGQRVGFADLQELVEYLHHVHETLRNQGRSQEMDHE